LLKREIVISGYYVHHRLLYPPKIPLQASVNAFMTRYSEQEAEIARQTKRLRQEPDEDGFITVTRGGRAGPARQEEAQAMAERQKQKNSTGLKNFYRFQLREERKKAQGELLRKFEEDRRKVQEMKRRRAKFKVSICSDWALPVKPAGQVSAALYGRVANSAGVWQPE
jgi:ribosomal RNA-processing protein 7